MSIQKIWLMCILLWNFGITGCKRKKKPDLEPPGWSGTSLPCNLDVDCIKVPDFFDGGCGMPSGRMTAIHREEIELYRRMYMEYWRKKREREYRLVRPLIASSDKTCWGTAVPRCRKRRCTLVHETVAPLRRQGSSTVYQSSVPEIQWCAEDEDCVKVFVEKCGNNAVAVNKEYENDIRELRGFQDFKELFFNCFQEPSSSSKDLIPVCSQGRCMLFRKSWRGK